MGACVLGLTLCGAHGHRQSAARDTGKNGLIKESIKVASLINAGAPDIAHPLVVTGEVVVLAQALKEGASYSPS